MPDPAPPGLLIPPRDPELERKDMELFERLRREVKKSGPAGTTSRAATKRQNEFFSRYAVKVGAMLRQHFPKMDSQDVEDITHIAFKKTFEKLFKIEKNPAGYLFELARNTALKEMKRLARGPEITEPLDEDSSPSAPSTESDPIATDRLRWQVREGLIHYILKLDEPPRRPMSWLREEQFDLDELMEAYRELHSKELANGSRAQLHSSPGGRQGLGRLVNAVMLATDLLGVRESGDAGLKGGAQQDWNVVGRRAAELAYDFAVTLGPGIAGLRTRLGSFAGSSPRVRVNRTRIWLQNWLRKNRLGPWEQTE